MVSFAARDNRGNRIIHILTAFRRRSADDGTPNLDRGWVPRPGRRCSEKPPADCDDVAEASAGMTSPCVRLDAARAYALWRVICATGLSAGQSPTSWWGQRPLYRARASVAKGEGNQRPLGREAHWKTPKAPLTSPSCRSGTSGLTQRADARLDAMGPVLRPGIRRRSSRTEHETRKLSRRRSVLPIRGG